MEFIKPSTRLIFVGARVGICNRTYDTFEIFRVDWQLGSGKAARAESTMHSLGQVHVFQSTPLLFKE